MTALSVFNKGRRKVIGGGLFQLFSGWGGVVKSPALIFLGEVGVDILLSQS